MDHSFHIMDDEEEINEEMEFSFGFMEAMELSFGIMEDDEKIIEEMDISFGTMDGEIIRNLDRSFRSDGEIMDDEDKIIEEMSFDTSDRITDMDTKEDTTKTQILMSNLICGASDYKTLFEKTVIAGLDAEGFEKISISEDSTVNLQNYLNWLLEAAAKLEKNIGLGITRLNLGDTNNLEENDHEIDDYTADFIYDGVVKLTSGQIIKLSVEALYYVHETYN